MRGAVRVGDYCQIAGISGTVEDSGISSLSLRTLDRSVVSIPNSKVAEANLENFSLRDQFWIHQVFTLRFDTPHDVVKIVVDKIYLLLKSNPAIDTQSARIRLINLTASGPRARDIRVLSQIRRQLGRFSRGAGGLAPQDDGHDRGIRNQPRCSRRGGADGSEDSPSGANMKDRLMPWSLSPRSERGDRTLQRVPSATKEWQAASQLYAGGTDDDRGHPNTFAPQNRWRRLR